MWQKLWAWCKRSETLAWARLQMLLGILAAALTYVDPHMLAGVLPPAWLPWIVLASGIATEYLRRRRDPDLGKEEHADDADIRGV